MPSACVQDEMGFRNSKHSAPLLVCPSVSTLSLLYFFFLSTTSTHHHDSDDTLLCLSCMYETASWRVRTGFECASLPLPDNYVSLLGACVRSFRCCDCPCSLEMYCVFCGPLLGWSCTLLPTARRACHSSSHLGTHVHTCITHVFAMYHSGARYYENYIFRLTKTSASHIDPNS